VKMGSIMIVFQKKELSSVSFIVCCVSFDHGVILCYVCYLFVVSYCKPLPPGKNPFAVNKYYITLLLDLRKLYHGGAINTSYTPAILLVTLSVIVNYECGLFGQLTHK
jgi:hypothetical protein